MTADTVPVEQRGKIGGKAAYYGLGHKTEDGDLIDYKYFDLPSTELMPIPDPVDPSWSEDTVVQFHALAMRVAAIGKIQHANSMIHNLAKPRSPYFRLDAVTSMVAAMERFHASQKKELEPLKNPIQFARLSEITILAEDGGNELNTIPSELAQVMLAEINRVYREIGKHGYAQPYDTVRFQAPYEIRDIAVKFSQICGSAVRFLQQLKYLKNGSRNGNRAHSRMTFGKRLKLVEEALEQLAFYCGAEGWSLQHFKLVTPEIKQLWDEREEAEPLPEYFARNLFDYTWPDPCNLKDHELDAESSASSVRKITFVFFTICKYVKNVLSLHNDKT